MHYIKQNDRLNLIFKDKVLKMIDEVKLNQIKRKIERQIIIHMNKIMKTKKLQ